MEYYELYYFYNRKDTGSIYVKTNLVKSEYFDDDDFLNALVENGDLSEEKAMQITSINEITSDEYKDMTGKE